MRQTIITISNLNTMEFFFTTNHCQKHALSNDWVSCTTDLPMSVVPRESLPSGIITNKEEYLKVFERGLTEIPNPQPEYQA